MPKINGAEAIPLVGGQEWHCPPLLLSEFERLYPGVDVPQTLREIRGWAITNPERRKTLRGVQRFVSSWLQREQDKSGRTPHGR